MLLCDGCDAGFHALCLCPPLVTIPAGDWFCPSCAARGLKKPTCSHGGQGARQPEQRAHKIRARSLASNTRRILKVAARAEPAAAPNLKKTAPTKKPAAKKATAINKVAPKTNSKAK